MQGYTARDVARMLDLPVGKVRSLARAGVLSPGRGPRGEYRFSFQDLVLLRTAKGLSAARVPPRRIRRALEHLRRRLPSGRPLSGVQIVARGEEVLVRDGEAVFDPASGQGCFDFEVAELARKVAPLARRVAREAFGSCEARDADDWYALGCELEAAEPTQAREAYRRALERDPRHVEAHVNLGRLCHEAGELDAAETHFRLALAARPDDPTALFNLGVSLEDLGSHDRALEAYSRAIAADPRLADAHYNLARLHEKLGNAPAALRHYNAYRRLRRDCGD